MADLRFQISGTSRPFTAQLLCTTSPFGVATEQLVEYSAIPPTVQDENHTCVIFSGLPPQTSYNINIIDGAGNTSQTTTPIITDDNPAGFEVERNLRLLGTVYTLPTSLCTQTWSPQSVPDGRGGKCIRIDPPLEACECIRMCLCGEACTSSSLDTSYVKVYKRLTPTASYTLKCEINDDDDYFTIDVGPDETICYDGMTILAARDSGGPYVARNSLEIVGTAASVGTSCINCITCGPETCLCGCIRCDVAVTTTTTSNTPYKVYFGRGLHSTRECKPAITAKLQTDPVMPDSGPQSFRVHFYLQTHYEHLGALNAQVTQTAKIWEGSNSNISQLVTGSASCSSTNVSENASYSRTVTKDNMGNYSFMVCSDDCVDNITINHSTFACMCICKIDQQVGGTFTFGGTMPPSGTQGIDVSTCNFAPYVPPEKFDRFSVDKPILDPDGPIQL